MYSLPTECPVCHDHLLATRMACRNCGTSLEGRFGLEPLFRLTPEQRHFVEVFLRCEGKISGVQDELGISYPTVRSRLNEVIQALGYRTVSEKGQRKASTADREAILERLARQEITSDEALRLLEE